jgi:tetratricopeptide (TPR) repeat protein
MLGTFRLMLAGRLRDAEAAAGATFEIGQAAGISDAWMVVGSQRLWIRYEQGRLDEAVEALSRAIARPEPEPGTGPTLAMMLAELGRIEEARALVEPWAAEAFRGLPDNYGAPYALTLVAAACARIGHHEGSIVLYDRLLRYRGLVAHLGPVGSGCVDHFLGLLATSLGRFDDADGHFREATAVYLGLEIPIWLARTRLEWAAMLLTRRQPGDADRAQKLLAPALATARQLGLGGVERRATQLLT